MVPGELQLVPRQRPLGQLCHHQHVLQVFVRTLAEGGPQTLVELVVGRLPGFVVAAERGAEWVRVGLAEMPSSQIVFGTDYPQAVRHDDEVVAYVKAVGALGPGVRKVLDGNAEKLIPNLRERLNHSA